MTSLVSQLYHDINMLPYMGSLSEIALIRRGIVNNNFAKEQEIILAKTTYIRHNNFAKEQGDKTYQAASQKRVTV